MPKRAWIAALDMAFTRLTKSIGIRPKEKIGKRQDRHDVMIFHGIRKFVNPAYVNAGEEPIKKELLIGHSPLGLEGSYLRPTEDELLTESVKVIPSVTLGQEAELKEQLERLKVESVESGDIDTMKKSYIDMRIQLEKTQAELQKERIERERLWQVLYQKGIIKDDS